MPSTVLGLPTHVLVIHAVVVGLPLTSVLLVLSAFSARLRARAGVLLPLAALGSLVATFVAGNSGQELENTLPPTPEIEAHAHAGDGLLPWAIAVLVLSLVVWWSARRGAGSAGGAGGRGGSTTQRSVSELAARSPLSIGIAVLATVAAVGAVAQVAYIGHLGAEATWGYVSQLPPRS